MQDHINELRRCFEGRVYLMGLGNVDQGDDGLGPILSDAIEERLKRYKGVLTGHHVINAGTMPERFIQSIAKKDFNHLIFLDAVDFGGPAGSVVFLNAKEMAARFPQISTHKISIGLLARWVEENGSTKAWLLGVQAKSLISEQTLSPEIRKTMDLLCELLCDMWISGDAAKKYTA